MRELRWQPPFNENYQHYYLDTLESLNQRIHDHLIWLELKAHATVLIPMSFLSFLNHPCWWWIIFVSYLQAKISQVIFRPSPKYFKYFQNISGDFSSFPGSPSPRPLWASPSRHGRRAHLFSGGYNFDLNAQYFQNINHIYHNLCQSLTMQNSSRQGRRAH